MQVIYPGSRGQSGEGRRSSSRLLRGQLGLNLPEPPREFWGHAPQSRLTWATGWAAPTVGDYLAHPDGPARGQSEGRHPASTLISDFRPPGLQDNKFPLFSAARGEVLCHSSLRKLIHPVYQRPSLERALAPSFPYCRPFVPLFTKYSLKSDSPVVFL